MRDPLAPPVPKPPPPAAVFGPLKQQCVPLGQPPGMALHGISANDCVYDVAMDDPLDQLRCASGPSRGRAEARPPTEALAALRVQKHSFALLIARGREP